MKTFTQIGTEIGELVQQKNAAYGSSFARAGDFLRLLWPEGIPAERFGDALLLVRIFDKQMRIATDKEAFGESPYADIAGYGILGVSLHHTGRAPHSDQETPTRCRVNASGPDASSQPKEQRASAAPRTSAPTTTSAGEPSAARSTSSPSTSASPANSSEKAWNLPESVLARTAPESATVSAVSADQEENRPRSRSERRTHIRQEAFSWQSRNLQSACAACLEKCHSKGWVTSGAGYLCCSESCCSFLDAIQRPA